MAANILDLSDNKAGAAYFFGKYTVNVIFLLVFYQLFISM